VSLWVLRRLPARLHLCPGSDRPVSEAIVSWSPKEKATSSRDFVEIEGAVATRSVNAIIVWILAFAGLSAYEGNFANYRATYGRLGEMIVVLLYFFVSAALLLFEAEMNAPIHPARGPQTRAGLARLF
jgi:hypothetical protein